MAFDIFLIFSFLFGRFLFNKKSYKNETKKMFAKVSENFFLKAFCKQLFGNFRELHGIFSRTQQKQEELNRKRTFKVFEKGETVFHRLPKFARAPKHVLGEASAST